MKYINAAAAVGGMLLIMQSQPGAPISTFGYCLAAFGWTPILVMVVELMEAAKK